MLFKLFAVARNLAYPLPFSRLLNTPRVSAVASSALRGGNIFLGRSDLWCIFDTKLLGPDLFLAPGIQGPVGQNQVDYTFHPSLISVLINDGRLSVAERIDICRLIVISLPRPDELGYAMLGTAEPASTNNSSSVDVITEEEMRMCLEPSDIPGPLQQNMLNIGLPLRPQISGCLLPKNIKTTLQVLRDHAVTQLSTDQHFQLSCIASRVYKQLLPRLVTWISYFGKHVSQVASINNVKTKNNTVILTNSTVSVNSSSVTNNNSSDIGAIQINTDPVLLGCALEAYVRAAAFSNLFPKCEV